MLRGQDVHQLEELRREGLSIRAISGLTGFDRKTVRKYLARPEGVRHTARAERARGNWSRSNPI